MKQEHIMDAMGYIDPALVAAADTSAPCRGKTGWVRAVLVAACLCLALVGTAVAAVEIIGVRINWQLPAWWGEDGYLVYGVEDGVALLPADGFSREVWELAEQDGRTYFSAWDELEQFLGWDLLDNPVLDGFRPGNKVPGHIALSAYADEQGLISMVVDDLHALDDMLIIRSVQICTDNNSFNAAGPYFATGILEGSEVTEMEYTAPSGLCAVVVDAVLEEPDGTAARRSTAHFSANGVLYSLMVDSDHAGDTLTVLKQVLDGFVLD